MKKKKLLFIIWSFTYGGGAEKILANIVNNLDNKKYDIDLIEYWHTDIHTENTEKNVNVLPPIVDTTKLNLFSKLYYKIMIEYFPNVLRKKYISKKYDVEISFNYLIPTFLLDKNSKCVSWIHGDIYDLKNDKKNYEKEKKNLKHTNKIVAISNNTLKSINEIYPEYKDKTILLYNGFNMDLIESKSNEIEVKKEKTPTILFVGRFDKNKNPLFLLKIAKKLKLDNIKFNLKYMGKGELESDILEAIKNEKLEEFVQIIGFKNNPYPYIKSADIISSCSISEGFPTILIEGMALGKTFITTNVGGTQEISNNEQCGFIANTKEEYYLKLKKLITNKNLYNKMCSDGKKHVNNFSLKNQIKQIENLIDSL